MSKSFINRCVRQLSATCRDHTQLCISARRSVMQEIRSIIDAPIPPDAESIIGEAVAVCVGCYVSNLATQMRESTKRTATKVWEVVAANGPDPEMWLEEVKKKYREHDQKTANLLASWLVGKKPIGECCYADLAENNADTHKRMATEKFRLRVNEAVAERMKRYPRDKVKDRITQEEFARIHGEIFNSASPQVKAAVRRRKAA